MYTELKTAVDAAKTIVIIQPENPDGDSLASALALENLLDQHAKTVVLYCAIDMPKYLRYIPGWDRVTNDWNGKYDLAIIVDTATETLLEKALSTPGVRHFFESHPPFIIDHHIEADEADDVSFPHKSIIDEKAAATSVVVHSITRDFGWEIDKDTASYMYTSIAADTLGLTTPSVSLNTFEVVTDLIKCGAVPSEVEQRRREFMRKPADILKYKGELIERIEYHLDGRLATVHIPWEDIATYSDRYNPSILVLDEMRLVEGVEVAVAIKTYPDGKLTGKIRSNTPIAEQIAGYFGGGGHKYSAGFKIYETLDNTLPELLKACQKTTQ